VRIASLQHFCAGLVIHNSWNGGIDREFKKRYKQKYWTSAQSEVLDGKI
jgi:hypothetical protein